MPILLKTRLVERWCWKTFVLICQNQGAALLSAIKEYEASKWKIIGQKVGKPPKVGLPTNLIDRVVGLTQSRLANNMQRSILVAGYDASLIVSRSDRGWNSIIRAHAFPLLFLWYRGILGMGFLHHLRFGFNASGYQASI